MDPEAWNSYTTFFTHVQQSCFFLRQEQWQEETQSLIHGLEHTSAQLLDDLHQNVEHTSRIRESTTTILEQSSEALDLAAHTKTFLEEQAAAQK